MESYLEVPALAVARYSSRRWPEDSMRRAAGGLGTLDRCGLTGCAGLASCPDDDRLVVSLQ
jgi:hypothetical protein